MSNLQRDPIENSIEKRTYISATKELRKGRKAKLAGII